MFGARGRLRNGFYFAGKKSAPQKKDPELGILATGCAAIITYSIIGIIFFFIFLILIA